MTKRLMFSWGWGVAALLSIPAVGFAVGTTEGKPHAPIAEQVSTETRAKLSARMGRHGRVMEQLVRSVVLLDRPAIRTLAERIADEETLSRAESSVSERRRLALSPGFTAEETQLHDVARQLAAAAVAGSDDVELADRFAALTRTCVSCHSVYMHGRSGAPGPKPLPDTNPTPGGTP
jgi:cytochrome c556